MREAWLSPALHYVRTGARGRPRARALASTPRRYLREHPEARDSGRAPLVHHLRARWRLSAGDMDDTSEFWTPLDARSCAAYTARTIRTDAAELVAPGPRDGPRLRRSRRAAVDASDDAANAMVDPADRLDVRARPDRRERDCSTSSATSGTTPSYAWSLCGHHEELRHFVRYGWRELRNPSPDFDLWWYWLTYLDPAAELVNPVVHYLAEGRHRGHATVPAGRSR